jgi:hypothetical protein
MTIRMGKELFWLKDPAHLFSRETWIRFFPIDSMTVPEALNAVVRFTVYFSLLLSLLTGQTNYLLFIPVIMALSVVLNTLYPSTLTLKESFGNSKRDMVAAPTKNNPFMNVLFTDYIDNPDRAPAHRDINTPEIKQEIDANFAETRDIFMDVSDKYGMSLASRNFVTQPSTTIPNDLEGFQEFLNKGNYSRKSASEGYVLARGSIKENTDYKDVLKEIQS